MNSSSIAGFGLGLGVAVAALAGLAVLAPAPPRPDAPREFSAPVGELLPADAPEAEAQPGPAPQHDAVPDPHGEQDAAALAEPAAEPDEDAAELLRSEGPQALAPMPDEDADMVVAPDAPAVEDDAPPAIADAPPPYLPQMPDIGVAPDADAAPRAPRDIAPPVITPPLPLLPQMRDADAGLPPIPDPVPSATPVPDPGDAEATDAPRPAPEAPATALPGRPVPAMPGQWQPPSGEGADDADAPLPEADAALLPAVKRNSLAAEILPGAALMGLILHDPGLPTPLRRELAAREIDFSVALNPLDPSAGDAATIYREAGKEVLIFANGIPAGADASDLDVTFASFFETLPQAVAVMDLPTGGFTRNARLLDGVLPLIARDGHGLVSFAGGTGQAARSAVAADIPHAEVFRVLDASEESPFTIRRFLDRAVFQASQVGYVLVFGDASNDAMLDAIDLWLEMGRVDDISLVPISAVLLRE
ncbi:MAG: divergent polysaccharide deacetylase family protein [Rhodobacteraceae bacterium]|nr:divergent polysaccharide deacetylase family protein [Paracoccaceae bacterium]